jgi:hypothetical protein
VKDGGLRIRKFASVQSSVIGEMAMALCYGEGSLLEEGRRGKIWKHGGRLVYKIG